MGEFEEEPVDYGDAYADLWSGGTSIDGDAFGGMRAAWTPRQDPAG
jgi:hypothetical protein